MSAPNSLLANTVGNDFKGLASILILSIAIQLTVFSAGGPCRFVSTALYAVVALIWLVPDRRIEKALKDEGLVG